jgi:uncharacterized protein with GYD domain
MPTYISLLRFTQKGIHTIKDAPAQLDAAKEFFKKMGADLKQYYLVMGKYDAIAIAEVPDDETVAKLALAIGNAGYVQSQTFRVFNEDEYRKIIDALVSEGVFEDT